MERVIHRAAHGIDADPDVWSPVHDEGSYSGNKNLRCGVLLMRTQRPTTMGEPG
jgi:hypothetical protein